MKKISSFLLIGLLLVPSAGWSAAATDSASPPDAETSVQESSPEEVCKKQLNAKEAQFQQAAFLFLLRRCINNFNKAKETERNMQQLLIKSSRDQKGLDTRQQKQISGILRRIMDQSIQRQTHEQLKNTRKNFARVRPRATKAKELKRTNPGSTVTASGSFVQ